MRKTLYLKFVLGYLIFGFFGFLVVATFVSSMTLEHLKREKADSLYKEATLIANTYASDLYSSNVSLEEVKKQLDALSTYLSSQIWIINPSGRIIMTTETPLDVEHESRVENFDSTITAGSFYTVGDFFGCFQEEMLSVFAPITSNFKVQGYVVIHIPMANIRASSESLLNISYIMLVIFFLLSLIILIFFTEMVYLPLRKITAATEQYAAGNLHYEFQVDSEDEIGYLAASLSLMASEIARAEDNQKKFIANVSHDFRSPLTSIKGYLEAGWNDPAGAPRKISRHRLKRDGTPDKADQQPADLKQPEYEGHDPGKICFRFKFGHSLYCRFLRRNLPAEAYRHRAAFNRRPYARSRRQKQNRAGLIQPARQRD